VAQVSNRFEYPLPKLSVGIDLLDIETKDIHDGSFEVRNTGGGVLEGFIHSRTPGLTFAPTQWISNKQAISYTFNVAKAGLVAGQTLKSHVYISTNGGEVDIPVTARLVKMSIITDGGHTLTNLQDFYEYAKVYPTQARRLFVDSEFYMLLLAMGYEFMEIYESLHKDSNRERALDNFFILSGLKNKTTAIIEQTSLQFIQNTYDMDKLHGYIEVKKSDEGYVDIPIIKQNNASWLDFYANKISSADFDDDFVANVNFSITPGEVHGSYAREIVHIGENTVEIVYHRRKPLVARLNRAAFRYEDSGVVEIANNTGKDLRIELSCKESYVRFSARSYLVSSSGEIPFGIKLSAFLSTQLFFRKLPYMQTYIEIKATAPGHVYRTHIPIIVGEL